MCVCVCVLEFMLCMGTYHPGGRAHCLGLAPRSRLSWDAPHFPPLRRALPGGHPGSAASSVNTWLSKALCLDPIFVIYIFRNSTWSGFSDLLHRECSVLVEYRKNGLCCHGCSLRCTLLPLPGAPRAPPLLRTPFCPVSGGCSCPRPAFRTLCKGQALLAQTGFRADPGGLGAANWAHTWGGDGVTVR